MDDVSRRTLLGGLAAGIAGASGAAHAAGGSATATASGTLTSPVPPSRPDALASDLGGYLVDAPTSFSLQNARCDSW